MIARFRLQVVSLKRVLFQGDVESVYLSGDEGEYEILPYHYPLLGALPEGEIKIKDFPPVPLRAGVILFQDNACTIIVEELDNDPEKFAKAEKAKRKQEEAAA